MRDVVIVGAGLAGCMAAARIAERGHNVLLLDSRSQRDIGNTWVNGVEVSVFPRLGIPEPSAEELLPSAPVTRFVSPNGVNQIELKGVHATHEVRMDVFTKRLLSYALRAGAEFREGTACSGPLLENGKVVGVIAEGEDMPARVVIDASGWKGAIRSHLPESSSLSGHLEGKYLVTAWREERRFTPEEARDVPRLLGIEPDINYNHLGWRGGYSVHTLHWDPRERMLDSLVGYRQAASPQSAGEYLAEFFAKKGIGGERVYGGGGLIPVRRSLDVLVDDGVLLAGDSACMVVPAHGSGVASSLIAGDLAARTIDRCLLGGDTSKEALWEYGASYQRDRGAMMAYFDVSRMISESLDANGIDWLIGYVMTPGDMEAGLRVEPIKFTLTDTMLRVRGLRHPLFTARNAFLASLAMVLRHLYRSYPQSYDPGELEAWRRRLRRAVRPFHAE